METSIQIFVVLCLWIIGLSHIVQPRAWADFFVRIRQLGDTAGFIAGFIHLPVGLLVVAFHHRLSGIPAIVTVIGLGWTLKGTLYFVFPKIALMSLRRISLERAWVFVAGGWFCIGLAGLITYSLLMK
jgi:hypothetical protein